MDDNNAFFGAVAVPAGELSEIASHNALDGADGAECATTGIREATPVPITPTDETVAGYKCVTQSGDDVEAINVGLPDQVPRFKPGSDGRGDKDSLSATPCGPQQQIGTQEILE
ncbi:unnamed protein product [Alternaria alternata]